MSSPLFTMEGILFLLRWLHIYAGIIWIGHLYYFNFVQGAFMKEAAAPAKPEVLGKLLPRAMWWFRWGAFWTMATGLVLIGANAQMFGGFNNSWGVLIGPGAVMGLIMAANVWFIIWPCQKVIIAAAQNTPIPGGDTAKSGARGLLASITNTLLSVPMLFFMAGSRHLTIPVNESSHYMVYWIVAFLIIAGIEVNAIKGKLGPIETIKGVITWGFVLTGVFFVLMSVIL